MRPAEHHELRVRTDAEIRSILRLLRKRLEDLYGERLRGLYLFGSYARGEADAESDVDVLVVLDRVESVSDEIERTGSLVSDLSLDADVSISRTFVSEADWESKDSCFLAAVRRQATRE